MEVSDLVDSFKRYPVAWLAGVASLAIGFFLYFTMGSLGELEQELEELEREVQTLKYNAREGADIEADFNRFAARFDAIDADLMDHTQIAKNNGFFYAFSQQHAVDITEVSQRPVIPEAANPPQGDIWTRKHYSVIPFQMQATGLLTDLTDMLYRFDASNRMMAVRRFELSTTPRPEVGYMMMSLELNVLGKPLNPATGGAS
jgi:Tfp pilus assembly protein PilO